MRTPSTATFRGTFTVLLCLILSPLACQVREAGEQNIVELPVDPTKMVLKAEALPLSNEQNSYGILVSWTPNEAVVLTRTETKRTLEGMEDFQRKFEFTASSHEYLDKAVIVGHQYSYRLQLKNGTELPEKFSKVRLKVPTDGEFQNPKNFKVLLDGHNWNRFYLNQTATLLPGDYTLNVDEFHAEKDAVFDLTGEGNPKLTIKTNKMRGSLTVIIPPTDDPTKPFSLDTAFPDEIFSLALKTPDGKLAPNASIIVGGQRYVKTDTDYKPIPFGIYEDPSSKTPRVILVTPRGEKFTLAITEFWGRKLFAVEGPEEAPTLYASESLPQSPFELVKDDSRWLQNDTPYLGLIRLRDVLNTAVELNVALRSHRISVLFSYGGTRQEFTPSQVEMMHLLLQEKDRLVAELKEHKIRKIEVYNNTYQTKAPFIDREGTLCIPNNMSGETADQNFEALLAAVRAFTGVAAKSTTN